MRSILRNLILAPVVMAAAALGTNSAMAQNTATVDVPFSFQVNGKTCPAGIYSVKREGLGNLVTLESRETPRRFTWLVSPGAPDPTATLVVLRFDGIGETHQLQSVQYGSLITARLDKKSERNEHTYAQVALGR